MKLKGIRKHLPSLDVWKLYEQQTARATQSLPKTEKKRIFHAQSFIQSYWNRKPKPIKLNVNPINAQHLYAANSTIHNHSTAQHRKSHRIWNEWRDTKKGMSKKSDTHYYRYISHPIKFIFIDSFDSPNCRIKEPGTILFLSYSKRSVKW